MVSSPPSTGATKTREPYSIEQIMGAVAPVLAALSGGPVDPADARAIASLLSADVNSPTTGIAPGQNLLLNADFIRRVAERKGPATGHDQEQARKQMLEALKHANVSSSAFAAALGQAGFTSAGLFARGAQSDDAKNSGRVSSSASYSREMPSSDVVKSLMAQGYEIGKINGAIGYAQAIGVNDNFARDLIKLDRKERDEFKGFLDEVKNLSPEEQERRAQAWSKKHGGKLPAAKIMEIIKDQKKRNLENIAKHGEDAERKADERIGISGKTPGPGRAIPEIRTRMPPHEWALCALCPRPISCI